MPADPAEQADTILAWMSETGSGDIDDLRQRVIWLARTAQRNPSTTQAGRWLRDMSALGHAEVDWDHSRWAIAPAAAALLPDSDGTLVLAGWRSLDLVQQLEEDFAVCVSEPGDRDAGWSAGQDSSRNSSRSFRRKTGQLPAWETARLWTPTTVYLQTESLTGLSQALAAVGVHYAGCTTREIAAHLPRLRLGEPGGSPAWDTSVEHLTLSGEHGIQFVAGRPEGDGLCRFLVHGRHQYRYRSGSDWLRTEHAPGIWWALAERREPVMRWRGERQAHEQDIGTVFIDQGAPLPPLQSRALVMCSGLPAHFGASARTAIYTNVPWDVADRVARSVRQSLSVID